VLRLGLLTAAAALGAAAAVLGAFLLFSFAYSLPAWLRLRRAGAAPIRLGEPPASITTLDEAVTYLSGRGLEGRDLVRAAQRLVAAKMEYSRRNNWDSPARAFERGMGYCQQQAAALLVLLRALGIEARMVQCARNEFPPKRIHEYVTRRGVCGHAWLRARVGGLELDVCPGHPDNEPGKVHFRPLGRVTAYGGLPALLGHFGSALLNTRWDRAARRAAGLPAAAPPA